MVLGRKPRTGSATGGPTRRRASAGRVAAHRPRLPAFAPVAIGVAAAVEVAVLGALIRVRLRGGSFSGLPPWAFLLMPAVVFAVQEHVERFMTT